MMVLLRLVLLLYFVHSCHATNTNRKTELDQRQRFLPKNIATATETATNTTNNRTPSFKLCRGWGKEGEGVEVGTGLLGFGLIGFGLIGFGVEPKPL